MNALDQFSLKNYTAQHIVSNENAIKHIIHILLLVHVMLKTLKSLPWYILYQCEAQ